MKTKKRAQCPCKLIIFMWSHQNNLMQFMKLFIFNCLQPPVISSCLDSNILLRFLVSSILNLCSFPDVKDQVSHPRTWNVTGLQSAVLLPILAIHDSRLLALYECTSRLKTISNVKLKYSYFLPCTLHLLPADEYYLHHKKFILYT
jgi:hypothetical protein